MAYDETAAMLLIENGKLKAEIERVGRELNIARYGEPNFAWSLHQAQMADLRADNERLRAGLAACEQQYQGMVQRVADETTVSDTIRAEIERLRAALEERACGLPGCVNGCQRSAVHRDGACHARQALAQERPNE